MRCLILISLTILFSQCNGVYLAGHCMFPSGEMVCFRQATGGYLEAALDLNSGSAVTAAHIHEKAVEGSCVETGGHYKIGTVDGSSFGPMTPGERLYVTYEGGYALSGENSVIGRSVVLHITGGERVACCTIQEAEYSTWSNMWQNQ